MKKQILCFFSFLLLLGCSGPLVKEQIIESAGSAPAWFESKPVFGRYNDQKVIFFYGSGESKFRDSAKEAASLNAAGEAAFTLEGIVAAQLKIVLGEDGKMTSQSGVIYASAKNVNVSGMMQTANYWQQIKVLQEPVSSPPQYFHIFRFYSQYAMDYEEYQKRRNESLAKSGLPKTELDKIFARLEEEDKKNF